MPIVRVDAFVMDNSGNRRMVASSYIKLEITRTVVSEDDKEDVEVLIDTDQSFNYASLRAAATEVGQMPWERFNNEVYGNSNISMTVGEFWSNYQSTYDIELYVTENGRQQRLNRWSAMAGEASVSSSNGVDINVTLTNDQTQTSSIYVGVNNEVKTDLTYDNVDGKGAEYEVRITLRSNNRKAYPYVVLSQTFYVKDNLQAFTYNPLYYHETYTDLDDNKTVTNDNVVVKGQLVNNVWSMSTSIAEHFERINGEDVFQYGVTGNYTGISFGWAPGVTGVDLSETVDGTTGVVTAATANLTEGMTNRDEVKEMTYDVTYVNGETKTFSYHIVFQNPFVGTTGEGVDLNDGIGENSVSVVEQVRVIDTDNGSAIYAALDWSNRLVLSAKATDTYKLSEDIVSVSYAFVRDAAYTEIISNITAGSRLEVLNEDNTDGLAAGTVIWENEGAQLTHSYNLTVIATVTFEDLSTVTCEIPVVLGANRD